MYAPAGFGYPEVGDVEVFPQGDHLHLFHLTLPNHDAVQHAVTDDALSWRELPTELRTSDPGACDDEHSGSAHHDDENDDGDTNAVTLQVKRTYHHVHDDVERPFFKARRSFVDFFKAH